MTHWPTNVHRYAVDLPAAPSLAAFNAHAELRRIRTDSGKALHFAPPAGDGLGYERRIWESGAVETRPESLHDHFNALVWLNFPLAKAALNARHMAAMAREAESRRDPERDALTHFDECGAVVVSCRPDLLELLRGFRWRELFVGHRAAVRSGMALIIFGHATLEQLERPFVGLTAKAILEVVPAQWFEADAEHRQTDIDARLAAAFAAGRHAGSRDFQPLPLLGWPGLVPENEDPAYYGDTRQFRPGRRAAV